MVGRSNYFIGADPSRWITEVPHYAQLLEGSFLPGIDLVYLFIGQKVNLNTICWSPPSYEP